MSDKIPYRSLMSGNAMTPWGLRERSIVYHGTFPGHRIVAPDRTPDRIPARGVGQRFSLTIREK